MKLWQKDTQVETSVEEFTVGQDRQLDLQLAAFDVLGSLAHTQMLNKIGLLDTEDFVQVQKELKTIYLEIKKGDFYIDEHVEDIHSQIKFFLTQRIGKNKYERATVRE